MGVVHHRRSVKPVPVRNLVPDDVMSEAAAVIAVVVLCEDEGTAIRGSHVRIACGDSGTAATGGLQLQQAPTVA